MSSVPFSSPEVFTGKALETLLFSSGKPVEELPLITGETTIPVGIRAKRLRGAGPGKVSRHLAKAVCNALLGKVQQVHRMPPESEYQVWGRSEAAGHSTKLFTFGVKDDMKHMRYVGYGVGTTYLAEALANPLHAKDLLFAWAEMLKAFGNYEVSIPMSLDDMETWQEGKKPELINAIINVSDELYAWIKYHSSQEATTADSRLGTEKVMRGISPQLTDEEHGNLSVNLAPALTDHEMMERLRIGENLVSLSSGPSVEGAKFIGPQLQWLMDDLDDRKNGFAILLTGQTGCGKTLCINEAIHLKGLKHETVLGSEGLEDRDIIGALQLVGGDTSFVDGPLTRACRRAITLPDDEYLVLWIKEITRIRPQQLNIFMSFMDLRSEQAVNLMGINAPPPSKNGLYYVLEIPDTAERIAVPQDRLAIVADCNIGGQYAVRALDPALDRRFAAQYELEYLGQEAEANVVHAETGLPDSVCLGMVRVAAETRRMYELSKCAAPMDTGSLVAWAKKFRREFEKAGGDRSVLLSVLETTALTTWIPRVAGRDFRGSVDKGIADGLLDFTATEFGIATA